MKLDTKNIWFCTKLFNYLILFAEAAVNARAGYMPVYAIILFKLCHHLFNELDF